MNAITKDTGRPRRSRQVRGSRRRNLDRAIGRGREREKALEEFVAAGGVLTDSLERRLAGLPPLPKVKEAGPGDEITAQLLDDMERAVEEIVGSEDGQPDTVVVPEGTELAEAIRESAGEDEAPVRASLINDDGNAVLVVEGQS